MKIVEIWDQIRRGPSPLIFRRGQKRKPRMGIQHGARGRRWHRNWVEALRWDGGMDVGDQFGSPKNFVLKCEILKFGAKFAEFLKLFQVEMIQLQKILKKIYPDPSLDASAS